MPIVTSDGVSLAVDVVGEGDPVTVLAHGLTGSRRDLAIFAPFLPGTKVMFDFRGHGDSGRPPRGSYTFDHLAVDLDAVAGEYGATNAAGWSLGAGAILRLLSRQPDRFERLVLMLPAKVGPQDWIYGRLQHVADVLEAHTPEEAADILVAEEDAWGSFDAYPTGRELRRLAILAMNSDGIPWAIRETLDDPPPDADGITKVQTPALVIGQEGDPLHHAETARELAALLPNADLVVFPDPNALIRDIPMVVQRVSAFLSGA